MSEQPGSNIKLDLGLTQELRNNVDEKRLAVGYHRGTEDMEKPEFERYLRKLRLINLNFR
ncbi:hypothetical protein [Nostoc sp. FACHB-888]|uniref:hypothetical protein n=1 Tax=Nostoc sp. FACHB-888 TaxID=2692842 RepID=UPI00168829D8|nr:hypothetical protein [Nostoc sp. FACHB-888]MBD2243195.1 hypothetical protein [Nostoc sp. FACHB-888]